MDKRDPVAFDSAVIRTFLPLIVATLPLGADPLHIAPTEAQNPEAQRMQFHLPPGFEIQLVLAEPDIGQPMNLSFDAKGRLWVTSSIEYPYPAHMEGVEPRSERLPQTGDDSPNDWVTIASGIGSDGRPAEVRRFAEELNIPIGQSPLGDGDQGIIYSIPDISLYRDDDGDGKADKRETLYSHFGNIDTHGMANSFRRWIDGWIYGSHGFRNTSKIVDAQGRETELFSGHTYRFRPDGSRFEVFTRGQVNPFGLTIDPLGNVFSADCHSRPLFQLLAGAAYLRPSWAVPIDEPLGLAPEMIDHDHGSTGICGPAYYAANHFPAEYRDNIFLCNPVTGRVHRDKLIVHGSTLMADTQPDFITCDDPWFRPVDATVGPDGALYIADFYNAIIGHYEVPLEHPKRDRTHGRVWRVIYKKPPPPAPDLTQMDTESLIRKLNTDNETLRVLITHQLVDHWKPQDAALIRSRFKEATVIAKAHLLWVLERTTGLVDDELDSAMFNEDFVVQTHIQKILAERSTWGEMEETLALSALGAKNAFVRRAAAEGMRLHPGPRFIDPLLEAWKRTTNKDTHLIHVLKMALREQLAITEGWSKNPSLDGRLLEIAAATGTSEAARLVLLQADPRKETFKTALAANAKLLNETERDQVLDRMIHTRFRTEHAIQVLGAYVINLEPDPSPKLNAWALNSISRVFEKARAMDRPVLELAMGLAGFLELQELTDPLLTMALKGDLAASKAILEIDPAQGFEVVLNQLAVAPAVQQSKLAEILSATSEGSEKLLHAMEQGLASTDLLRDSLIRQKLGESNPRLTKLLKDQPDSSEEILKTINHRRNGFDAANRSFKQGQIAFQTYCMVCHSMKGEGGKLGPNLDGVELRGVERLLEDILDPNRNVDPAFSLTTLRTRDGQNISGIGARQVGGRILLTDTTGIQHSVLTADVVEETHSRLSLMPAALGSQIPENDLYDLVEFLLGNKNNKMGIDRRITGPSSRR